MVVVELGCVLPGDCKVSVAIEDTETIFTLKTELGKIFPSTEGVVKASDFNLYLGKLPESSEWLESVDVDAQAALNRITEAGVKPIDDLMDIKSVFCAPGLPALERGQVHVLAAYRIRTRPREEEKEDEGNADERPAKRLKGDAPKQVWTVPPKPTEYYLMEMRMHFVNRDRATEQLLECHRKNYYRAKNEVGDNWEVPLVDNIFGLGKTSFSMEYIGRCQKKWDDLEDKEGEEFLDLIHKCHTIVIKLVPEHIHDENGHVESSKAQESIKKKLCAYFDSQFKARPDAFRQDSSSKPLETVLNDLILEVGPLFLVLDEIGMTFNWKGQDDITKRGRFMEFCLVVLQPLFDIQGLFFLIAGRAPFLSYVGLRPTERLLQDSPFKFVRLSLNFLRPPAIKEIIVKTFWEKTKKRGAVKAKTLQQHYNLKDDQVTKVSKHLFKETFGHPRSLLQAFRNCNSYSQLMNYEAPVRPDDNIDWELFTHELRNYKKPLRELMDSVLRGEPFNLTNTWQDGGGKIITFDLIADRFDIAWEGKVDEATLHMPDFVKSLILLSVYPFRDQLEKVSHVIGDLPVDYAEFFELLFMARFQEVFCEKKCPNDVLPGYFTDQQQFGRCKGVQFSDKAMRMPKVTKSGNNKNPSLITLTVHTDKASSVMRDADGILEREHRLNLKPGSKSASPDVLLMTMIQGSTTLTVGLAVKNYAVAEVRPGTLKDECEKFNKLCSNTTDRMNVLVVCATKYSAEVRKSFESAGGVDNKSAVYPSKAFENINEVILLNLSTPDNRAEFFGISAEQHLQKALEDVVNKVEVECVQMVCPEKMEDAYRKSKFVSQVFVAWQKQYLVAIVVPNATAVVELEPSWGNLAANDDKRRALAEAVRKDMNEVASGKLNAFEYLHKIHLTPDDFTEEDGLLTSTLAPRRDELAKHFKGQLEELGRDSGCEEACE